jgi:molybdopterin/thiamine biosynthesis adenylyltransferase
LAYPFRKFILIDPDILTVENVERHALGASWIGRPKVAGMKDYLLERGIAADTIQVFHARVQDVLGRLGELPDLMLLSIDQRNARLFVNSYAVRFNIPLLDGGVFAKGTGGQVLVVPSPKDVCYRDAEIMLGADHDQEPHSGEYGVNIAEGGAATPTRAIPALRASVDRIACHMARLGLDMLTGKEVGAHILQEFFEREIITRLPPSCVAVVEAFCAQQAAFGLLSTIAVRHLITHEWALWGTGVYHVPIPRAESCPEHAPAMHMDDIL